MLSGKRMIHGIIQLIFWAISCNLEDNQAGKLTVNYATSNFTKPKATAALNKKEIRNIKSACHCGLGWKQ